MTITGRQASTTAWWASLGTRSWSSRLQEIDGAASLSIIRVNPPVGWYFSRRIVSIWWRTSTDW